MRRSSAAGWWLVAGALGCSETDSAMGAHATAGVDATVSDAACVRAGCPGPGGGRLCVAPGTPTVDTCDLRRTDYCLIDVRCERQPSGACGFTMTDAVRECLANNGPRCTGFWAFDSQDAGCEAGR